MSKPTLRKCNLYMVTWHIKKHLSFYDLVYLTFSYLLDNHYPDYEEDELINLSSEDILKLIKSKKEFKENIRDRIADISSLAISDNFYHYTSNYGFSENECTELTNNIKAVLLRIYPEWKGKTEEVI